MLVIKVTGELFGFYIVLCYTMVSERGREH
nr:MAG TPA: hypothetical protein [Caudoviricetes sp.]